MLHDDRQQGLLCVQERAEEQVVELQTMLHRATAAEAEANQRADAEQRVATTLRQRNSHLEQALQQVCSIHGLVLTSAASCLLCAGCHACCHTYALMDSVHL